MVEQPECYTCGSREAGLIWVKAIQSEQCAACVNTVYAERDALKAKADQRLNDLGTLVELCDDLKAEVERLESVIEFIDGENKD